MALTARSSDRIDWRTERDTIDLAAMVTRLLGPAPGRRGERGRRLWWSCPFHEDRNPSFCVDPGKGWWRCFGCGEHGDAAALVMRLQGATFPEAIAILTGRESAPSGTRPRTTPEPRPSARAGPEPTPDPEPRGMSEADALALVESAAARLWTSEGSEALAYLTGRGLDPATIEATRLGWTPRADGVPWRPPGIVIPWSSGGRLVFVKVRVDDAWRATLPEDRRPPKYLAPRGWKAPPTLYPGPESIRPGRPAILTEGEFDAILLGQELGELASVVTLGSASGKPTPEIRAALSAAPRWFIATDADDAGDRAADLWGDFPRARRVRPPSGAKDWTELHAQGFNAIRYLWLPLLGWRGPSWDDLASWSWGADAPPTPGAWNRLYATIGDGGWDARNAPPPEAAPY